jgi:hypothetical protein
MGTLALAVAAATGAGLGWVVSEPKHRSVSASVGALLGFACVYVIDAANAEMLGRPTGPSAPFPFVPSATPQPVVQAPAETDQPSADTALPVKPEQETGIFASAASTTAEVSAPVPSPGAPLDMRGHIIAPNRPGVS